MASFMIPIQPLNVAWNGHGKNDYERPNTNVTGRLLFSERKAYNLQSDLKILTNFHHMMQTKVHKRNIIISTQRQVIHVQTYNQRRTRL